MKILIIGLIIVGIYYVQRIMYEKTGFNNFEAQMKFNSTGVFPGDKIKLISIFTNKKMLPLWYLGVKFKTSRNLAFDGDEEVKHTDNYRKDFYYLSSYEKLTKESDITALKRGYYKIDEAVLETGDVFGTVRVLKTVDLNLYTYVYPALIPSERINIALNRLNGDVIAKRNMLEDPFQLKGIREYSPFDSLKKVNWKATARAMDLRVNVYDTTVSGNVTILYSNEKYNKWDNPNLIEEGISLASSLSTEYINQGMSVEIVSNAKDVFTGSCVRVRSSSGMGHKTEIYEALARVDQDVSAVNICELLREEMTMELKGKVIIFISHFYSQELEDIIMGLRAQGFDINWVFLYDRETQEHLKPKMHENVYLWEVR